MPLIRILILVFFIGDVDGLKDFFSSRLAYFKSELYLNTLVQVRNSGHEKFALDELFFAVKISGTLRHPENGK
jgi:hypothetical protein